jgi:hypothetical protein
VLTAVHAAILEPVFALPRNDAVGAREPVARRLKAEGPPDSETFFFDVETRRTWARNWTTCQQNRLASVRRAAGRFALDVSSSGRLRVCARHRFGREGRLELTDASPKAGEIDVVVKPWVSGHCA